MSNVKSWRYTVYQVPFKVMQSLSNDGKPIPFLYRGNDASDSEYEFTRESARDLYARHGYTEVARFDVQKLDDVFDVSNNPYRDEDERESLIDRIKPMHSVSIGDIIFDSVAEKHYIVAPMGFDELGRTRRVI